MKQQTTIICSLKISLRPIFLLLITIVLIIFLNNSCAPAYVPNAINTPLLNGKGKIQANLNAGASGLDPQLAYAFTDEIGIMLNGSFVNNTSDSTENFWKHIFVELGTGFYTKIKNAGRFETYGGIGYGNAQSAYSSELFKAYTDVNFSRIFLQPALGMSTKNFDGSIAARFVVINMLQESEQNTGLFIEPVITGKLGYKNIKALAQFGLCIPLIHEKIEFNFQPLLFSIGLQYTFNKNTDN